MIAGYRIVRELGRGGMATVYLAVQESLGREVALKVMSPALAGDAGFAERFLREARLMASFRHRALVPVFEAGRNGEALFLAMEYLPGGNAGDLRGGDPAEIRRCLLDVALGLAYIHARGVVHRDLKPENILRREDGGYVLSDFGIARSGGHSQELTAPHSAIGTPSYMSPEQWRGETVDARSDLYSLGIVAFELLTGRTPFSGEDGWSIGLQHMQAPRPRLAQEFADWQALLDRLLDIDRGKRPANAAEVVAALGGKPETTPQPARATPPAGLATQPTPLPGRLPWWPAWLAAAALLAVALAWSWRESRQASPPALVRSTPAPASAPIRIDALAVLPLANVSGDPAQDYFVDGMTDELINHLSAIEGLRVISRTSTMLLKGSRRSLPELARELGVQALIEGSVLREGSRVRINVALIDAAADVQLWSQRYARDVDGVLALQEEVSGAVALAIQRELRSAPMPLTGTTGAPAARVALGGAALDELLRGRDVLHQGINESDPRESVRLLQEAVDHFERALAAQPEQPQVLAELATALHWLGSIFLTPRAQADALYARSREAAERALAADPDNVLALNALAYVQFEGYNDWKAAARTYARCKAVRTDACSFGHAIFLSQTGQHQRAFEEILLAERQEPLVQPLKRWIGSILYNARRYAEAIAQFERLIAAGQSVSGSGGMLARAYVLAGRDQAYAELYQRIPELQGNLMPQLIQAWWLARRGDAAGARALLATLQPGQPGDWGWAYAQLHIAVVLQALGDAAGTREHLRLALTSDWRPPKYLNVSPEFDGLRGYPEFQALVRATGLEPAPAPGP